MSALGGKRAARPVAVMLGVVWSARGGVGLQSWRDRELRGDLPSHMEGTVTFNSRRRLTLSLAEGNPRGAPKHANALLTRSARNA
jgi:hypothetical protein